MHDSLFFMSKSVLIFKSVFMFKPVSYLGRKGISFRHGLHGFHGFSAMFTQKNRVNPCNPCLILYSI